MIDTNNIPGLQNLRWAQHPQARVEFPQSECYDYVVRELLGKLYGHRSSMTC